jgi:uncharacterized membrane protein
MIVFANPLALLLAVPLGALILGIWRNGFVNLGPQRRIVALVTRLTLVSSIILALAGLAVRLPQGRQSVVFVSDLSASDAGSKSDMQELIRRALAQRRGDDLAGIVSVGRAALVEQPVSALSSFDGFQSQVDTDYTNLEGGLDLAGALLPEGYRHRVVLLSDGQQNLGDALSGVRLLRSRGVRVDVVPLHVPTGAEVLVDRVDVPSQLRPHESFTLGVSLHSNVDTTTRLDIYRDRTLILSRNERIRSGESSFRFHQAPLAQGFHTYQVRISPTNDTSAKNNIGSAFTSVQGGQRILVIAADRTKAVNVLSSLKSTGIRADFETPGRVVPTLASLQRYAAVVLVDTPADTLGPDLMDQLVPYVRNLGHGLVVTGGDESFGLGGYGQTPLEQVLPVKMDLPKRKDLPSVAVALLIESLEVEQNIDISKAAGKGAIKLLTEQDQVAVNDTPDDGTSGWVVPLQHVRNKAAIDSAIDRMEPGDAASYAPYLQAADQVLKHTTARVKHILLLGDGDAEDPSYKSIVEKIRADGITVSAVGTNDELGLGDLGLMRDIAHWGGGRYYRADSASKVPKIFLRDARTVARSGMVEGRFYPREVSANPMLRDLHATPALYGYVITKPKPTGEVILMSKKHDPVLAGWQYGLGRTVAWTSDAAGRWTRDWLQAPGANRFWANLVSWTLPATQAGHLFVSTASGQGQGRISVDTPSTLGASPSVSARVVMPNLHSADVELQPVAPGQYRGTFAASRQGSYFVTVEARGSGHTERGQAGLAVPYSAEYRETGMNIPFLHTLAVAGGGSFIRSPGDVWRDNLSGVFDERPLSALLWLLALLLLPVDIGIRRLIISRSDLAEMRGSLRSGRSPVTISSEPLLSPLEALRAQRAWGDARAYTAAARAVAEKAKRKETAPPPPRAESPARPPEAAGPQPAWDDAQAYTAAARARARGTADSEGTPSAAETGTGQPQGAASPGEQAASAPSGEHGAPAPPAKQSTTSRLLAAKRRRR